MLLCSLLLASVPSYAAVPGWNPARTWVFVVGLLEWQDSESFESFPQDNRRDRLLVQQFKQAGVPSSNIVHLIDSTATSANIEAWLARTLAKTAPGDTLFLYYCGHGYEDDDGDICFASYDASDETPGWAISSIVDTVDARFRGSRAFLTADCCYSGALVDTVKSKRRRVSFACLTSAEADEISTANWTFTDCLLDGFAGAAGVDSDNDGAITLLELARYTKLDMAEGERQGMTFWASNGFPASTVLARARPHAGPRVGERLKVKSEGEYYAARIVDESGNRILVHYLGYDPSEDEWMAADELVARARASFKKGEKAEVLSEGAWWVAKIVKRRDGRYYVHYSGYGDEWNEWVDVTRIRKIQTW